MWYILRNATNIDDSSAVYLRKLNLQNSLSQFSTRRIFPCEAERLLYLHCLFLTMVTSSRSATRVFESPIDFNFSAASYGSNHQCLGLSLFASSHIFTPVEIENLFPRVHCFRNNRRSAAPGNIRLVENRL